MRGRALVRKASLTSMRRARSAQGGGRMSFQATGATALRAPAATGGTGVASCRGARPSAPRRIYANPHHSGSAYIFERRAWAHREHRPTALEL